MSRLTAKQAAVLGFMREYQAANDNMPTIPVIAHRFGYASPNAANQHVQALVKHGHLERLDGQVGFRFVRETPCAAAQV
jgi:SOS-response transcriptional repressor LexA